MARSRNIKPGTFKNEILGEADPLLTLLFIGLWTLADREGRLEDRPKRIKIEVFPYRELDINRYLTELERLGFIHRYTAENVAVIEVLNFKKHQSPHKTEKPSDLPECPPESIGCRDTVKAPLSNESETVKESLIPDSLNTDSLKERAPRKRGSRLPDDWCPNADLMSWAVSEFPNVDHQYETDKFTDHWRAKSGKDATKLDWDLTWKNWIRKADEYRTPRPRSSQGAVRETNDDRRAREADEYRRRILAGGTAP